MSPVEHESNSGTSSPTMAGKKKENLNLPPPPCESSLVDSKKKYLIVSWDLDTTGRRLMDEICHVGSCYLPEGKDFSEMKTFSQYVMPYKNLNPGARRSFGIGVVSIGRYRMLKDMSTDQILKTKSEISALQEFIEWLKTARDESKTDYVVLAYHEASRKIVTPILLEALYKYNLMPEFQAVVKGFVNGLHVVQKFGDPSKVTSLSLRSLCKTVLNDTNPLTASALGRSQVLMKILITLLTPDDQSKSSANLSKSVTVAANVSYEEEELKNLKAVLNTQGTLRPLFEGQLKEKRSTRERAVQLRKMVAESGLDLNSLSSIYKDNKDSAKDVLLKRVTGSDEKDVDELIKLLEAHFEPAVKSK